MKRPCEGKTGSCLYFQLMMRKNCEISYVNVCEKEDEGGFSDSQIN